MCFDILGLAGLSPIKIEWSRGPLPLSIFFPVQDVFSLMKLEEIKWNNTKIIIITIIICSKTNKIMQTMNVVKRTQSHRPNWKLKMEV